MSTTLLPSPPPQQRSRTRLRPAPHRQAVAERDDAPVSAAADRAVIRWLVGSALAVTLAVAVGGITRLTESGLSITQWKPLSGVLPPLGAEAWVDAYQRYLTTPEAQTVHRGITLSTFKGLYWWEWTHRMLARGVGLVLAIPFFALLMRRRIRPGMRLRLANLPLLAAIQGGMGWYMVQSGLSDRTSVSPYRLVAHLAVALVIFGIAVWTASELRTPGERTIRIRESRPGLSVLLTLAALVFVTILTGGFVAGLDAGRIFNTFPLMEGRLIPVGYGAMDGWRNAFENPIAAQLHHRILALSTALLVFASWLLAVMRAWPRALRRWLSAAAIIAAIQVGLGIVTVLLAVPLPIAVLHQLGALTLLAVLLAAGARVSSLPVKTPELYRV